MNPRYLSLFGCIALAVLLAVPAVGLVKGLSSAYYAVQATRTPVRFAAIAVQVAFKNDFVNFLHVVRRISTLLIISS